MEIEVLRGAPLSLSCFHLLGNYVASLLASLVLEGRQKLSNWANLQRESSESPIATIATLICSEVAPG